MSRSVGRVAWLLGAMFVLGGFSPASVAETHTLSKEDKSFLDDLFKNFVFDPVGYKYVRIPIVRRTVWAKEEPASAEGWLKPATAGQPARFFFMDGDSIPAPKPAEITELDLVTDYRANPKGGIVTAAWLHRLGHDDLAADCLARISGPKVDALSTVRKQLAWEHFADMVHAYMVRADAEALRHGEQLLRVYPKEAAEYRQSEDIVADLKRRKEKGTFGKAPPKRWPEGFATWEPKKKVAYLIDALDEVDQRQWGQPGGVDLSRDRRVSALIDLGEVAVPDLIDTVEKDHRLTRSVHFFRDFAQSRTVMAVREAALVAAMSIMQVEAFHAETTGDDFTSRGDEAAANVAARLREYWKKLGNVPFDERMMKILNDPKSEPKALREAAENLARGSARPKRGTTMMFQFSPPRQGPNPAIEKFKNPTAAEAILAAMDRDLAAFDAAKPEGRPTDRESGQERLRLQSQMLFMRGGGDLRDFQRQMVEDVYIQALMHLDDKRIAPALVKRSEQTKNARMRRRWSLVCQQLGEAGPLKAYAADFREGKIKLPADKRPDPSFPFGSSPATAELQSMVRDLIGVNTPEADQALMAMAEPAHPYHERAELAVLNANVRGFGDNVWFTHRVALALLRDALSNTAPTGTTFKADSDRLNEELERGTRSGPLPDYLQDESKRKVAAPERVCDVAAQKITELVLGVPPYHALFKDADARLKSLKETLDRYAFRPATPAESEAVTGEMWRGLHFVPDIVPLGRPATADDVHKGKALFHLGGNGKVADAALPLEGVLKVAKEGVENGRPKKTGGVLIVQAEIGADGKLRYGVITTHTMLMIPADDVKDVKPVPVYFTQTIFSR